MLIPGDLVDDGRVHSDWTDDFFAAARFAAAFFFAEGYPDNLQGWLPDSRITVTDNGSRLSVDVSPIDTSVVLGKFQTGQVEHVELAVKVLDGTAINGHVWVFYGALSDVEYTIRVTDTTTGKQRSYTNPPFNICGRADTEAF